MNNNNKTSVSSVEKDPVQRILFFKLPVGQNTVLPVSPAA